MPAASFADGEGMRPGLSSASTDAGGTPRLHGERVLRLAQRVFEAGNLRLGLREFRFCLLHVELAGLSGLEAGLRDAQALLLHDDVLLVHADLLLRRANVHVAVRHVADERDERVVVGRDGREEGRLVGLNLPAVFAQKSISHDDEKSTWSVKRFARSESRSG